MTLYHVHHLIEFNGADRIRTKKTIRLSVTKHAEAHRRLYVKYGHWKDYVAWKGLSGQMKQEDIILFKLREAGRYTSSRYNWGRKHSIETKEKMRIAKLGKSRSKKSCDKQSTTNSKREYMITDSNNKKYVIRNLKKWSIERNLSSGNMFNLFNGKINFYKGYNIQLNNIKGVI